MVYGAQMVHYGVLRWMRTRRKPTFDGNYRTDVMSQLKGGWMNRGIMVLFCFVCIKYQKKSRVVGSWLVEHESVQGDVDEGEYRRQKGGVSLHRLEREIETQKRGL